MADEQVKPSDFLKITDVKMATVKPGKPGEAIITAKVHEGMHVQANPASKPNLIATALTVTNKDGLEAKPAIYPEGKPYQLKDSADVLSCYEGTFQIKVPIGAGMAAKVGKFELDSILKFQACNDKICFFPQKREIKIPAQVLKN